MSKRCRLCGAVSTQSVYRLHGFEVLRCPCCSLVFLSFHPSRHELTEMYGPAYFEERHNYFFTPAVVEPWMKAQNGVLHEFHQVTGLLHQFGKQGKLLDVGCATGVFLALARDAGWEPYGVDISSYATAFAQERLALKNVMAGTLREVHFPAAFFDAVTLLDVFEHLPEPLTELYEIHRILKKGGLLLINTPNEQSLLRRVARLLYLGSLGKLTYPVEKLYHAYHLCSYTQERLEGVLKDCGFTITWAAKKPIGGPKGRISPLMRRCLMTFAWVEKLLNMEYELLVVAQKVS